MIVSQSSAPSPTSISEAFSLKQFGFNNAIGDPNQFDYTMQDVSTFSQMDALPPIPTMYNQQQEQQQQPYQNIAVPQPQQPQPTNRTTPLSPYVPSSAASSMPLQSLLDNNNEGLFKNNPNNPFFGIPTSMDWTEWNEWSQSNQGSATWHPLA